MPIVSGRHPIHSAKQGLMLLPEMLFIDASLHASCLVLAYYQFKAAWDFPSPPEKHVEMQTIKYRVMDVPGNRTIVYIGRNILRRKCSGKKVR